MNAEKYFIQQIQAVGLEDIPLPELLYKYRIWDEDGKGFHNRLLTHNEVFFAKPSSFEDPDDCKNSIRYDLMPEDEILSFVRSFIKRDRPNLNSETKEALAQELFLKPHWRDSEWSINFEANKYNLFDNAVGILSLTSNEFSIKMWEHYSDHHKGICYGFHSLKFIKDVGKLNAGKVSYSDSLPTIKPTDDFYLQVHKKDFCKKTEWSFEEEYRLKIFKINNRNRIFKNESLAEVIVGKDFPIAEIPKIKDLLRSKNCSTNLYQCLLSEGIMSKVLIEY